MANLARSLSPGRLRRGEAGVTAIEFAIVAPILILLFGAIFEIGTFIFMQNRLQFATEKAARSIWLLKVGPPDNTNNTPQMNISAFKTLVCSGMQMTTCTDLSVDVRNGKKFADIKTAIPNPATGVGKTNNQAGYTETYEPGGPGMAGSLIVTYDWKFAFPGPALLFGNVSTYPGIRRLVATAVFKNEGQQ
ncbi:MAG: pilus assembly protein [Aestuariivirga sp.]|uniref:TadE/TadG family type IV pilus assembly protein n=1 Tax=Aestuariivirga sp. TaxID=2650926 RepID=UPI0025BCEF24|nr:TadE/TadG family type IV pilus assembly protein [Aestuariivirga sp.]MCA3561943.1 pilus assembly protein [Aestuariivirga sp.]